MFAVLSYALHHLAEQGLIVCAAVGWAAGRLAATRRASLPLYVGGLLIAGVAAAYRADKARLGVFDHRWEDWAGYVAMYEAGAAQVLWLGSAVVALAATVGAPPAQRVPLRAASPALAALLCAVAGLAAPHVAWCALVWVAIAFDAWRGAPWRRLVLTSALAAGSTAAGGLASLGWVAILVDPRDVVFLDTVLAGAMGAMAIAAVWLAGAVGVAGFAPARVRGGLAALLLGTGIEVVQLGRGLTHGPTADVSSVAATLPVYVPARAARVPGGCLVDPAGDRRTIGRIVQFDRVLPCPEGSTFPGEQTPLLAFPPNVSIDRLRGWHDGPGHVALLTRLDDSRWLAPWRVNAVDIPVWPGEHIEPSGLLALPARARPLPGAVLVFRRDGTLFAAAAEGMRPILAPVEVLPEVPRVRQDVLIHASTVPTVADLLQLRDQLIARAPHARCVLVFGDAERWSRQLRAVENHRVIQAEWETVESDEVN